MRGEVEGRFVQRRRSRSGGNRKGANEETLENHRQRGGRCSHRRLPADAPKSANETSEGNLGTRHFSNGLNVARHISSYVIKAGSGCSATFRDQTGFNGNSVSWNQNCENLTRCFGPCFNDRALSLAVT